MSDAVDKIRAALQAQSQIRIETVENSDRPKYTTYQGDRKIQQLGDEILDDNQLLSNMSVAIGDPVMPLAKGDVIRRVDSINGGANLGTPFRRALENDALATGNNRSSEIGRNGGLPSEATSPNFPNGNQGGLPKKFPPPNGCVPVSNSCFWSDQPTPPQGYQGYGDAVLNEDGLSLYLYCKNFTPPSNLGCSFLTPTKWACSGGTCSLSFSGIYNSREECEAARIPPPFTGGQCVGTNYSISVNATVAATRGGLPISVPAGTGTNFTGAISSVTLSPLTAVSNGVISNIVVNGVTTTGQLFFGGGGDIPPTIYDLSVLPQITSITLTGSPDNCGDLPYSCPI